MARYSTPYASMGGDSLFGPPYVGFQTYTGAPDAIQVPQMRLRDPFTAANPITPAYEKTLGRYTALGDSFTAISNVRPQYMSDRLNVSVQRQVPGGMVLDVTYFMNYTRLAGNYNMNQVDPRIAYQNKSAVNVTVPNPFYNVLPVEKFPGTLRYQRTIGISSLMKRYPQYGNLTVIDQMEGFNMKYQSLQMRLQKNFSQATPAGGVQLPP